MKKFFLFSVMALVALATGCSKDDTTNIPKELLGEWEHERYFTGSPSFTGCPSKTELYSSNGTKTYIEYSYENGECKKIYESSDEKTITFSVKGTKLIVKGKFNKEGEEYEQTEEYTIIKITDTELILSVIKEGEKEVLVYRKIR